MKLAALSTYPPRRCGIGVYARHLAHNLLAADADSTLFVAAEEGADTIRDERLTVLPLYGRDDAYVEGLLAAFKREGVELVHIQHAPDLLGEDERLPRLLGRLRGAGIRSVVTLHTVYANGPSHHAFYLALAKNADRLILHHEAGMASVLRQLGISSSKLAVIPHGTSFMPPKPPADCRRLFGLPEDAFVFLCFGFVHVLKNIHTVEEAFLRLARRRDNTHLLIAGMPFGNRWYNHAYLTALKLRARAAGLRDRVHFHDRYLAPEAVPELFGAASVLLLPHWQKYGSASGVFHQAIGAHKPAICARGPKFADGLKILADFPELAVEALSMEQWERGMRRLHDDPDFYLRAAHVFADYAQATAWPKVAAQHLALYRELLENRQG